MVGKTRFGRPVLSAKLRQGEEEEAAALRSAREELGIETLALVRAFIDQYGVRADFNFDEL